ncbi:oxysterol-binding protein [Coniella lustricola]|uniref:Oxysterol-binding protein n=1 Tax=Coniella lustricola TaxID=2025994 RepID=A0A2T3AB65_9PEZI|nr:oxysterol-binding protein [Coniella lustricola]
MSYGASQPRHSPSLVLLSLSLASVRCRRKTSTVTPARVEHHGRNRAARDPQQGASDTMRETAPESHTSVLKEGTSLTMGAYTQSYIVRWVKVDDGHTISWSLQPHKKSINFGIVKHPGSGSTNITANQVEVTESLDGTSESNKKSAFARKDSGNAQEQLVKKGFLVIDWHGKCEADKVSMGNYDVDIGRGGMFGLIFDNTFSKQTSKTATFVLLTYPTGAPPQTARNLPNLQAGPSASVSRTSLATKGTSPGLKPSAFESVDSLQSQQTSRARAISNARSEASGTLSSGNYHTGLLLKRRRKKGQGYARRFFSLDFATCTLSYYHDRNSSALRGAIPLSLAAIAADESRREISIDSGAEIWHLKASNDKDFSDWARALEKASRIARGLEPTVLQAPPPLKHQVTRHSIVPPPDTRQEEDREWQQVEALVSRVVGTRDALRRLVKDAAAQKHAHPHRPVSSHLSPATPPIGEEGDYFNTPSERRSFWKRKSSTVATPTVMSPTVAAALAVPSPGSVTTVISANGQSSEDKKGAKSSQTEEERTMYDHCTALLGDLDLVVAGFSTLLSNSKRRRMPATIPDAGRASMESTSTEEFFDAEEAGDHSQLLVIDRQSEDGSPASEVDEAEVHDDSSVSSVGGGDDAVPGKDEDQSDRFPNKPKSLTPLPITEEVKRRTAIPQPQVMPPSLIAFVRKNVGKDLSTISMPVSANEPTSMLQRVAEQLEYANLLDAATKQDTADQRMLYVAAFAVSQFSGGRVKERSIRKPFNPLLGETFELVRGDKDVPGGLRLIVEKVTHRPVRLAMQADSASWSLCQSPAPAQKFWGKSAEITTEGRVRIVLRLANGAEERYSWNIATMFLRNVVMGEKYVEPVGDMSVLNEDSGAKAVVEFRSKGMFGGRSEDVQIDTYGADGKSTGLALTGNWTASLKVVEGGKAGEEIWRVGALVDNAAATYGMTLFAAGLNEITTLEKGKLPPTDTRLRPDQRLWEDGKLDDAEEWKVKLEEAQRSRRKQAEDQGVEYKPKWFAKVDTDGEGEEVWKLKGGKDGYWEERARGQWTGVEPIFNV